jgi:hypothetical protein
MSFIVGYCYSLLLGHYISVLYFVVDVDVLWDF